MSAPPVFFGFRIHSGWHSLRTYLLSGGVLGYPAEYAYALGEVPTRRPSNSATRLYQLKERSPAKPILYLVGNLEVLRKFALIPPDPARRAFLFGPPRFATYLLNATALSVSLGMARNGKVALRIPAEVHLRRFLIFLGEPLSGTSLNLSGSPPLRTCDEIKDVFPDLAIVDGGFRPGTPVSPILDLTTFDRRMLRGSWTMATRCRQVPDSPSSGLCWLPLNREKITNTAPR